MAAACLLSALIATWPLAARLTSAVPRGTEHEATVPVFSLWTLWWTADRAAHGLAGYWDAPFFHPNKGVFTFSEPMVLAGLLSTPLWAAGAPPALVYNLVLLGMLALGGVFAYRLARALGAARLPALLGGVLEVTLPVVAKLYGVLPVVPLFGMLWTLEGLVRFARAGRGRAAAWAAAGFTAQYLVSQQLALLFAPLAAAAGLLALAERRFQARAVAGLGAAGLLAGGLLSLVAVPMLVAHAQYGFRRSEGIVQALSARPGDFLTRPSTALLPVPARDHALEGDTGGLFPGAILLALAAAGTALGLRDPVHRRWSVLLALSALIASVLALGLNASLLGWQPFATVRAIVPGMGELRSVFRFALVAQAMLPVLAARALSRVAALPLRHAGFALSVALALLGAAENLCVPQPLVPVPFSPATAWSAWLRAQPDPIVIAHVPLPAGLHVSDYEGDAWHMFAQVDHHKPMINGYSSNFPPGYGRFQLEANERFPDYDLLCSMNERMGVNTLVIDQSWLAARRAAMDAEGARALLVPAYEDAQVRIYRLAPPQGHCVAGS